MAEVSGTPGSDLIYGTDADDAINGEGGDDRLFGFGGNDTIEGGDGNDDLHGGTGADTMKGGAGDDVYDVDAFGDQVIEGAGGGYDTVFTTINYILGANVERLLAFDPASTTALTLIGNALDNEITGNFGNNVLDGGAGQDILTGNRGDDQYIVSLQGAITISGSPSGSTLTNLGFSYLNSSAPDIVAEITNGGTDTIWVPFTGATEAHSWIDYTLLEGATFSSGQVERLGVYDRTTTYAVNLQGDVLNNELFGNEGANILDGWTGADTMTGYGGDDTYFFDNVNDVIVEKAGEGFDTVNLARFGGSFTLFANIERAIAGPSTTTLIGNNLSNVLIGNDLANTLSGSPAIGTDDNAVDVLQGGGGNDQYRSVSASDQVIEFAGGGRDLVIAISDYTLPNHVEELTGRGSLTGNDLDNIITGSASNDVLDGRAGADTLIGLGGNDAYIVDNINDVITETADGGTDTVFATFDYTLGNNIERLIASPASGTAPLRLTGDGGENEITGNAGDNVIDGKGGVDVLQGLEGADTFAFTSLLFGGGADQIVDFEIGVDKIALDNAIFTALQPGSLAAGAFAIGTQAHDADDRIIYDPETGWLYYDYDGDGASGVPIHFATVHEGLALTAGDFVVI